MSGTLLDPTPRYPASVAAVLDHAWSAGVFRTDDIIETAGLTRSTAIAAIDQLIELGLVRELANARTEGDYRKGRPARRFELRSDAAVLVGLDAGHAHLTTTVADLGGTMLTRQYVDVDHRRGTPTERRDAATRAVHQALVAAGRERADVLAVGIGVPAPVNSEGHSPPHRSGFWRRMNPGFRELFAQWAPIVRVENDASLAAVAEGSVGAARGCSNYVALLAGNRLGAGVVIDGHLLRGAHGGAGELRAFDQLRAFDDADGVVSARGLGYRIAEWARDAISTGAIPSTHPLSELPEEELTARAILSSAFGDDHATDPIVQRAGRLLARIVGVFGSVYDPQRIIISGAVAAGMDRVIDAARPLVPTELDLPAPDLVASALGGEVVSIGAISAAREAARDGVLQLPGQLARR